MDNYRYEKIAMYSVNQKKQEDMLLSKLISNRNHLCQQVIPTELRNEFVREIVPDNVFRDYAQALRDNHTFDTNFPEDFVRENLRRRININRFGNRLLLCGVDPKVVISGLLHGI